MIVREPETNTEAPFLGKEGSAMLELWTAQMEWLSSTGQLNPHPVEHKTEDRAEPEPSPEPPPQP